MASRFPVSVEKEASLLSRMNTLGIKESDLEESFTRSGGKGGQNVNKTSTAVHLKHKPSGIEIKCSIHRTQGLNRYKARDILCNQLEAILHPVTSKSMTEIQKIQKRKKEKKRKSKKKTIEESRIQELEESILNSNPLSESDL